jgi:hypothetical protein
MKHEDEFEDFSRISHRMLTGCSQIMLPKSSISLYHFLSKKLADFLTLRLHGRIRLHSESIWLWDIWDSVWFYHLSCGTRKFQSNWVGCDLAQTSRWKPCANQYRAADHRIGCGEFAGHICGDQGLQYGTRKIDRGSR